MWPQVTKVVQNLVALLLCRRFDCCPPTISPTNLHLRPGYNRPGANLLLDLPPELILTITDFLDASDTACLALCCYALHRRIGIAAYSSLRISKRDDDLRKNFLDRVASDNPRYFLCHTCSVLHPVARVHPPGIPKRFLKNRGLRCKDLDSKLRLDWCFLQAYTSMPKYQLLFHHFRLAMERHRRGLRFGVPLESLSRTEVIRYRCFGNTILVSVEPKIVDDELILRIQQVVWFEQDQDWSVPRHLMPSICPHTMLNLLPRTLDRFIHSQFTRGDCPTYSGILCCRECSIEFHFAKNKNGLTLTKWLNLGRGDSLPDKRWRADFPSHRRELEPLQFTPAAAESSIQARYERFEAKPWTKLMQENASTLHDRRYETTFNTYYDKVYYSMPAYEDSDLSWTSSIEPFVLRNNMEL